MNEKEYVLITSPYDRLIIKRDIRNREIVYLKDLLMDKPILKRIRKNEIVSNNREILYSRNSFYPLNWIKKIDINTIKRKLEKFETLSETAEPSKKTRFEELSNFYQGLLNIKYHIKAFKE